MTILLKHAGTLAPAIPWIVCCVVLSISRASSAELQYPASLWTHDNLFAWATVPFDEKHRGPEARAQMLRKLGFQKFAYDWRDEDFPTFSDEIDALTRHGITLLSWWFPLDGDDPRARGILELFKSHNIHPQLWVPQTFREFPKTAADWRKLLPAGVEMPGTQEEFDKLSNSDKDAIRNTLRRLKVRDLAGTPQGPRLNQETNRVEALVRLAAPYGCRVELYSHDGWFGDTDNLLSIIEHLRERGVTGVGIVYNFLTARDELHDDVTNFRRIWKKIKPYVVAINVTGIRADGDMLNGIIYPSQGEGELEMMRVIQESGWVGPVGVIAEKGGDAEVTLRSGLVGLDWLAVELQRPGGGGERPFPVVP